MRRALIIWGVGAIAAGCATSATSSAVRSVAVKHQGASFEATAQGCERTRRTTVRQFTELADAVSWGKAAAALAPNRSCDVVVEAVRGDAREEVFRVSRDARGVWTVGSVGSR